jgi:hypothetical protein
MKIKMKQTTKTQAWESKSRLNSRKVIKNKLMNLMMINCFRIELIYSYH